MGKGILASAWSYAKNLTLHLGRLTAFEESPREVLAGVTRDSRKLGRAFRGDSSSGARAEAAAVVEEGRQAYNDRNYAVAEEKLRNAITLDKGSALAYTYLGYALYKQGRTGEAAGYWRSAILADPGSEAASKALKKLQLLDRKKEEINDWVQERGRELK